MYVFCALCKLMQFRNCIIWLIGQNTHLYTLYIVYRQKKISWVRKFPDSRCIYNMHTSIMVLPMQGIYSRCYGTLRLAHTIHVHVVRPHWVDQWKNAINLAVLHVCTIITGLALIDCQWKCACYTSNSESWTLKKVVKKKCHTLYNVQPWHTAKSTHHF